MSENTEENINETAASGETGFPIADGLRLMLGTTAVTVKNGELHLADGNIEQRFVHALVETGQRGLYEEAEFEYRYDSFGNPLHFDEQDNLKLGDINAEQARSMGVLSQWNEMDEKRRAKKRK